MSIEELREQPLDSAKYFTYPWLSLTDIPFTNKYIKLEREEKPMKKNLRQRLYEEKTELSEKIKKIKSFRESESFEYLSCEDRDLLIVQENAMVTYHEILNIRYRKLKGEYK